MKFEDLNLSDGLLEAVSRMGITIPTEIQAKTIKSILAGKDVIGESATGSGKTLAFGCGIVAATVPGKGLQSLVLTPTRELAEQVKDSLRKISSQKQLSIITIYGGVSINPQIDSLHRADVVVATPGRLLDHLERGTINLSKIKLLVLDEADRMLDMGFIDDVARIVSQCPKGRQTLFFSATISNEIKRLADRFMINPLSVSAMRHVDPSKLHQVYFDCHRGMKLSLLAHLLQDEDSSLVMVFCNTRRTVDFVVKNLRSNGVDAIGIHGGFTQNKRTNTLSLFNNAKVGVMVCTDVAARGLHVDNVSHVYNYEVPKDSKDYVHRIGRTARAGEEGKVINLLCDVDYDNFGRILRDYPDFVIDKVEKPFVKRLVAVMETRSPYGRPQHGRRPQHRRGHRRN